MYPALTVLQAVRDKYPADEILWVGGQTGIEVDLVVRVGTPYRAIPAAGLHGVGLKTIPALWKLFRGTLAAGKILREFHPDVLFFTGGYVAGPVAFAGRNIPSLLFVPDIEPGVALKMTARYARCIAIVAQDSRTFFSPKTRMELTGYPTRVELSKWQTANAREHFNLQPDSPVLLVFGGSLGARSINRALKSILHQILEQVQVIHISGKLDWEEMVQGKNELPSHLAERYHLFSYLHSEEMGAALASADLAVSRAGASTLGEFPLFGLPAILVPYPHAWRYQKVNAQYLVDHDAAIILEDNQLGSELLPVIQNLLRQPEQLAAMKQAAHKLSFPTAALQIADLLHELADPAREAKKENLHG